MDDGPFVIRPALMKFVIAVLCLTFSFTLGPHARAEYEHDRRRELWTRVGSADVLALSPLLLSWSTTFEPRVNEARRTALAEEILRTERLISIQLNLPRRAVGDAVDFILDARALMARALDERLDRKLVGAYSITLHQLFRTLMREHFPEFAANLDVEPDVARLRADLFARLRLLDWRDRGGPMPIGFDDDHGIPSDFGAPVWRARDPGVLMRLARAHAEIEWRLDRARVDVERFVNSPLRDRTRDVLREVERELHDQALTLPSRVERMIELARRTQRPSRQEQSSRTEPWVRLGCADDLTR